MVAFWFGRYVAAIKPVDSFLVELELVEDQVCPLVVVV